MMCFFFVFVSSVSSVGKVHCVGKILLSFVTHTSSIGKVH